MIRKSIVALAFLGVLAIPNTVSATCIGDWWGARSTAATATGRLEITMNGTTGVHHTENHFNCGGNMTVRVELWGGATCSSGNRTVDHKWYGENTRVDTTHVCGSLEYDLTYTVHGTHIGFNDETTSYVDNAWRWQRSAEDLDGDGYSPDGGDCNDESDGASFYPGAQPPFCGLTEGEFPTGYDYNCDGIDDATQISEVCPNSPIVIDLAGNGFNLTDAAGGVRFDLDRNGIAEQLPWTSVGSDDVWLALDRNDNGRIDDGGELFGNYTSQPASSERNGFLALAVFDQPVHGGNGDGIIDPRDAIYMRLLVWRDVNHDGVSQPLELNNLAVSGIPMVSLDYREARKSDRYGNWFRYRARVSPHAWSDSGPWAYDVFLAGRPRGVR